MLRNDELETLQPPLREGSIGSQGWSAVRLSGCIGCRLCVWFIDFHLPVPSLPAQGSNSRYLFVECFEICCWESARLKHGWGLYTPVPHPGSSSSFSSEGHTAVGEEGCSESACGVSSLLLRASVSLGLAAIRRSSCTLQTEAVTFSWSFPVPFIPDTFGFRKFPVETPRDVGPCCTDETEPGRD